MRVLVFSDIHGNLPAFENMIRAEPSVDLYVSLGDVVNYGPWSNECVDLLQSLSAVKIMGNHEEHFIAGIYPGKNQLVQLFFEKCIQSFDRMQFIRGYQREYLLGDFVFVHTLNDQYIFPDTEIELAGNFFIGHSHHQFERIDPAYHIVNVGSVGQNRKEINVINYGIFETEHQTITLKSLIYDIDIVINKMRDENYPEECIAYYQNKPRRKQ